MTIIEGVGDEVTQFFVVVLVVTVAVTAWLSTNIAEQPLIRTVLILERRTRERRDHSASSNASMGRQESNAGQEPPRLRLEERPLLEGAEERKESGEASSSNSLHSEVVSSLPPENSNVENLAVNSSDQVPASGDHSSPVVDTGENSGTAESESGDSVPQSVEDEPICESVSGNNSCLIRKRRLAFFEGRQEGDVPEDSSSGQDVEVEETPAESREDSGRNDDTHIHDTHIPDSIRIRLMYLNDTQKLVEGKLNEQLGDFKRRHFGLELAANKLVRLIFNGQVLQSDSHTLQHYGLFDNCVVHCLVHHQRGQQEQAGSNAASETRDWDLGHILFLMLSIILSLAWYCRFQYSQFFTTATTVALVGLSGIFVVSLVGVYLPDQDGVRQ